PGAVNMRSLLGAERVETVDDRAGKLRMPGVDPGIDDGNPDALAMRQRMRFRQMQLGKRILCSIAFAWCRLLVLQQIAEVRLHRVHACLGREIAARRLNRAAVGDTEQSDGCPDKRKSL